MNNLVLLLIPLTFVVGGISIWKGRGAERLGGIALIVTLLAQFVALAILRKLGIPLRPVVPILDLVLSVYLATSFMVAAFKFSSPWLGVACIIQAIEMGISAVFGPGAMDESHSLYIALLNALTFAVIVLLAVATARSLFLRKRRGLSFHDIHGVRILTKFDAVDVLRSLKPQKGDWPLPLVSKPRLWRRRIGRAV